MSNYRLAAAIAAAVLLAGGGAAFAQMPPGDGPHDWGRHGDMGMEMGHYRPHPAPGAAFRLRKGDAEVDVKCSVRESSKDCVDSALRLLDRVNAPTGAAPEPAPAPTR